MFIPPPPRSHRRAKRLAAAGLLLALMAGFGFGVYTLLGHFRHLGSDAFAATGRAPTTTRALVTLPGTIYVAQGPDLYALHDGGFRKALAGGDGGSWTQPAVLPGGGLVAVLRGASSSDLYHIGAEGTIAGQLTDNAAQNQRDSSTVYRNHWAFFPRPSADGASVLYSTDNPKQGYRVDYAVWSQPLAAPSISAARAGATRWTTPSDYTGGDVQPVPLAGGGMIYVRYTFDDQSRVRSQLWLGSGPHDDGHKLTEQADNCAQPDLSPDGRSVAMVCTQQEVSRVEVAPFDGSALGPARVVVDGSLAAYPTWAPDGGGIVYLSPKDPGGQFQLWWLPSPQSAGAKPVQVTDELGLDATSRPAWGPG